MTNQIKKVFIQPESEGEPGYMVARRPSIYTNRQGKEDISIEIGYPDNHPESWGKREAHDHRRYYFCAVLAAEDLSVLRYSKAYPDFINQDWLIERGLFDPMEQVADQPASVDSIASLHLLSDFEIVERLRELDLVSTYIYHINKDERGEYSFDLRDI